jgi:dTDP-4-amino-4,6-dideoxygalactose transaminase
LIPIIRPELPPLDEYTELLREIWSTRMLSNFSRFAAELEEMTAEYLSLPTRVVVSGDIGLVLTIASLDLERGSSALVPSFTFNSTVNALLWNGLRPVFVDIDPDTLNLDPKAASRAADATHPSLIVATHVFGNPADTDALAALSEKHGARLIYDAAHGYGSRRGAMPVGNFGDAEVFSLSGTKPVTSAEGGLVASHDTEFLTNLSLRRGYGFKDDYNTRMLGLNGKMSELHAALGLLTMRRIETALGVRDELVRSYLKNLAGLPGVTFQSVRPEDRSTYKDFAVLFDTPAARDAAESVLRAADIQTKRYFRPCHTMDAFRQYFDEPLPVTEDTYARILCLPLFEAMRQEDIDRICSLVRGAVVG